MSYANHVARPPTPPGGRSSINKFVSSSRHTLPNLQQLYLDSAARRDQSVATSHGGGSGSHVNLHSRFGSLADLRALHRLLEGQEGEYEWARKTGQDLEQISTQKKNGALLGWFYARQNAILDSWNEVDVILYSPFPAAILKRFASKDQVRQSAERKQARKAVKFYDPTPKPPSSPSASPAPLEFSVRSHRKPTFPSPCGSRPNGSVSPGTSPDRKVLLSSSHDEPSSNGGYGSLSDTENAGPSEPSYLNKGRRYSGKTLADLFGTLNFPSSDAPKDTIIEMPSEDDAGPWSPPVGAAEESSAVETDADLSPVVSREISVHGESDLEVVRGRQPREPSIATAHAAQVSVSNPDGKRERERKRLMAHVPGLAEKDEQSEKEIQFAIKINLAANVALLVGKILACLSSRSISLFASLVDSALDLLSTLIIFGTSRLIAHRSFQTVYKYPVGKRRFEPLGVVIFSVLMIASFLQVLLESSTRLWACLQGAETSIPELPLAGIATMLVTVVLKAVMWIMYRNSRSSGVRAVAQDAENDVVFNVVSLTFPQLGQLFGAPALDPIGGVLLSLYIIHEWVETLVDQVTKLSGKACGSEEIARALYLVTRFKDVESVSGLEVYHAGDGMIIEADVVLPYDLTLKEAHDVGEVLTFALECLTDVERAYVHLDYNAHGPMGHLAQRG